MRFRLLSLLACLAVVAGTAAIPAAPPVRAGLDQIQGKVTHLGVPVAGVVIEAQQGNGAPPTATSAADGTYTLNGVTPFEKVILEVTPPSPYIGGAREKDGTVGGPDIDEFSWTMAVLKNIALVRVSRLSGTIDDDNGSPVAGTVTACNTDDGVCLWPEVITNGAYGFDVWSGHYTVSYDVQDPATNGYYAVGASGRFSTSSGAATRVTVADDTTLPPVTVPTLKHVTGAVALASGGPASGAVRACEAGTGHCTSSALAAGGFEVDIPAGSYTFYLDLGAPAKDGWYSPSAAGHVVMAGDSAPIVMIARDAVLPAITARIVHQVSGSATVAGGAGLTAELTTVDGALVDTVSVAPDTGGFAFPDVAAGSYKLRIPAGPSNAAGWYSASAASHVTRLISSASTVSVTAATTNLALPAMTVAAAFAATGTLTTSDGAPAVDVTIAAYDSGGNLAGSTSTDDAGSFIVNGLVPGSYSIRINLDGGSVRLPSGWYTSSDPGFTTDPTTLSTVAVNAPTSLGTITAPRLYVVTGAVFGGVHPVAHIGVDICSTDDPTSCESGSTDAGGQYAVGRLPADTYTVQLVPDEGIRLAAGYYAPGTAGNYDPYQDAATQVVVAGDVALDDVALPSAYGIHGTISNCSLCTVEIFEPGGEVPYVAALVPGSGVFSVMVVPGSYYVAFTFANPTEGFAGAMYNGTVTLGLLPILLPVASADLDLGPLAMPDALTLQNLAPPEVQGFTPANGATAVARNATLQVTFTEPVIGATASTITLRDHTANTTVAVTVSYASGVATIKPAALLPVGHIMQIEVGSGITDTAGLPLTPRQSTFSVTADGKAPYVSAKTPRPWATWVSRTANIRAVFSESVTGVTAKALRLKDLTTGRIIAAVVTYTAATRTAVLNPARSLPAGHRFTVLTGAAIRDRAGNPVRTTSWTFVTRR